MEQRRLAAILAADIAGYSALMAADEARTVRDLKGHQAVVLPMMATFGGRVIDTAGDGILAEFASVVNALECAVAIQKTMAERNASVEQTRRLQLGDVICDEARIYGDGINVAARLEGMAQPGGICISGKVYDEIRGKIDLACEYLGEHQLKNIVGRVRVYGVGIGGPIDPNPSRREVMALPDKPSIAVLPFANMSGDSEQEYFADGLAEEITTALSKYRWLFVIARNSSFTYKGRAVEMRQVGRELGARYVLEGSIRKSAGRVRITAQLIDTSTGAHIWADRYDRELIDIFAVQDEITQSVAGAIQPELISAEFDRTKTKQPDSMEAWDYVVRGRQHLLRLTRQDNADAQRLLRKCLERDPDYVSALAYLSWSLTAGVILGWSNDVPAWLAEARKLAERAAVLDTNDAWVQCALGLCGFVAKQPAKTIEHFGRAIELNPSFALGHGYLALQLAFVGEADKAIEAAETAIRLSPRDPELFHFFVAIGTAHFVAGRYNEAVMWAEKSVRERPSVAGPQRLLATALAHLGRLDEARQAFKHVLEITPQISAASIRRAIHFSRADDLERYIRGLRLAGLPE
jgi:adenylate cyclase